VLQGPDKGRTYQTGSESALIGRHSDQIHLTDHSASRRHAEIRPQNGSWVLVDLNSSNATYLNGRRVVRPTTLKHGDQIKVGSTLLVFSGKDDVESVTEPGMMRDLVDVDADSRGVGSSILSSMTASEESVILPAPETADAVAAWNAVYKIAEMIGSIESVPPFLERVADIILDHLVVDRLVIFLHNPRTEKLTPTVVRYRHSRGSRRERIVASRTIINHVLATREGLLCANAMTDERFAEGDSQDSIHRLGLRSTICVPVLLREEVEGIIHMDCSMSHHTYTQEQLRLAVAVARFTAMAIENARLLETRVRTERLAAAGETVAYLSHHIRNIVQGMQGGASLLEIGIRRGEIDVIKDGWGIVHRNLDRTIHLTMNMLTFSKERQPRMLTAQLNKTVEDALSLVQRRADEKSVMVLSELDDVPAFPFDPHGMHQVIHNIVLNAIEAVPPHSGRVNVNTHYDSEHTRVEVTIHDNGPGVAPEMSESLFEAFHSSKGHGGTGLGLAAARKIVHEHGGSVTVESPPGEGTIFRVVLPANGALADSDGTRG
jgi:signal transduction histidine kinase